MQENGHQMFLISYTTVTLHEGQRHPKWYQNVELSSLYHHTKFERNQSVNVWIQANIPIHDEIYRKDSETTEQNSNTKKKGDKNT